MLSIYDSKVKILGSYKETKAKSARLAFEEVVLGVGGDQGTFYTSREA